MTIVVGHDGSDSGDDAAVLGARLARAIGDDVLVVTIYPQENPIGVGRVDAEWVGALHEHAQEVSDCAKRFLDGRSVNAAFLTGQMVRPVKISFLHQPNQIGTLHSLCSRPIDVAQTKRRGQRLARPVLTCLLERHSGAKT